MFFEAPHRIRETLEDLQRRSGRLPSAVGRELTKVHEELVRGPISAVSEGSETPVGSSRWSSDIGHIDRTMCQAAGPTQTCSAAEFGEMTNMAGLYEARALSRRSPERTRWPPNEVYKLIETAKKSGRMTKYSSRRPSLRPGPA